MSDSNNLPVPAKSFEDRFLDKLKEGMADMMTPEELRKLIERGVDKFLFESRTVKDSGSWSSSYHQVPSLMEELLNAHLAAEMQKACDEYLRAHPEQVKATLDQVFLAGLASALVRALDARCAGMTQGFMEQVLSELSGRK